MYTRDSGLHLKGVSACWRLVPCQHMPSRYLSSVGKTVVIVTSTRRSVWSGERGLTLLEGWTGACGGREAGKAAGL